MNRRLLQNDTESTAVVRKDDTNALDTPTPAALANGLAGTIKIEVVEDAERELCVTPPATIKCGSDPQTPTPFKKALAELEMKMGVKPLVSRLSNLDEREEISRFLKKVIIVIIVIQARSPNRSIDDIADLIKKEQDFSETYMDCRSLSAHLVRIHSFNWLPLIFTSEVFTVNFRNTILTIVVT